MEEKKSIKFNIGTVICMFIILLLIIALILMWNYTATLKISVDNIEKISANQVQQNSASKEDITKDTANENDNNLKISASEITVSDAINFTDEYYKMFKVKLPKIDGNTSSIKELNSKILNETLPKAYKDAIFHTDTKDSGDVAMSKGSIYDYKFKITSNILVIYIYSEVPKGGTTTPASGDGLYSVSYCYDIENDKEVSNSEVAERLNLNISNIEDQNGNKIKSYKDLKDEFTVLEIENDKIKINYSFV